jgi:hypothetical protein
MCTHDSRWVERSNRRLAEALKLQYEKREDPIHEVDAAQLWKTDFRDSQNRVILANYAIVWSAITQPQKDGLCYDSSHGSGSCPAPGYELRRGEVNGKFKSGLLNDCLSDAMIYLGPTGSRIRAAIGSLIERVENDRAEDAGAPLFVITESLGSKILVDTLKERRQPPSEAASLILADTRQVFMAANQLALLDLGASSPAGEIDRASSAEELRLELETRRDLSRELRNEAPGLVVPIKLVGFNDPNDLLSYGLCDRRPEVPADLKCPSSNVDVFVSNALTWLFAFENPMHAHEGYLNNKTVWTIIACGSDKDCGEQR